MSELKRGIVLLGHGSRRREANLGLEELAGMTQAGLGLKVMPAFFQFNKPDLFEVVACLVAEGVEEIVIVPAFLFSGMHLKRDLPMVLDELKKEYGPQVRFFVTKSIGPDPRLAEIFMERVRYIEGDSCILGDGRQDASILEVQDPGVITARSRRIIDRALGESFFEKRFPGPEGEVVRRVVHAMGNPDVARLIRFHPRALETGIAALNREALIFTDVGMVKVGINRDYLRELGSRVFCPIHRPEVRNEAREKGLTRAMAAVRLFRELLQDSIVVVGNAPTALAEVLRQCSSGFKPALIVGMPVGFVGASEVKLQLANQSVPYITLLGCQGGSTAAVAVVNALLAIARGEPAL